MPPERVHLTGLTKHFRRVVAVDGIDLDIAAGEFFSLLGPSGCGKTTTLRLVAGFERPDAGEIRVGDVDMTATPPHRRPVNTVFQHYALFPHLTVADNVGFGLRFTEVSKPDRRRRIGEALDLVQMGHLGERMPAQLSGGQQQRVALARALVLNPSVLLLDEPLGALDAKLRKRLQVELKALQERVGITFLYVTHDQEEALTMSDRLAVMDAGRIRQVGTPREVYEAPTHAFVADFLGAANLLDAVAFGRDQSGRCRVRVGDHELHAGAGARDVRGAVKLVIRPERVVLEPGAKPPAGERLASDEAPAGASGPENVLPGVVERHVFQGPVTQVLVRLPGGAQLQAMAPNQGQNSLPPAGTDVLAHLPAAALRALQVEDPVAAGTDD
ncbi:MAG TPA: ABC transporter ATP-binding protein [Euzebyales bacterium]|nr:ABC transporter ATP-binding protein [Euzebyales bacterium]